jgi:hypothetical protein
VKHYHGQHYSCPIFVEAFLLTLKDPKLAEIVLFAQIKIQKMFVPSGIQALLSRTKKNTQKWFYYQFAC